MRPLIATVVIPVFGMLAVAVIALAGSGYVVAIHREVVEHHAVQLIHIERLRSAFEWKVASNRGFFLTRDPIFLEREVEARREFMEALDYLRQNYGSLDRRVLFDIDRAEHAHQQVVDKLVEIRKADDMPRTVAVFEKQVWPRREELRLAITALEQVERANFDTARKNAASATRYALFYSAAAAIAALLLAAYLSIVQSRRLRRSYETEASLRREAEGALAARAELLSVVSHELRTPIFALKLQLDLLRKRMERGILTDQQDFIARSERQLQSLTDLIDRVLDLGRYERGHFDLRYESVDLAQLAHEIAERFCGQGMEIDCSVEVSQQPLLVTADAQRVEQILVNLLSNAMKYAHATPVKITVSGDDHVATITVKDDGPGIPPHAHDTIFRRFERVKDEERPVPGLGLGLYISRLIAEAHGGSLTVFSEPGQGAAFTLTLPRRPPQQGVPELPQRRASALG